jgi:hypothetical protein
MDVELRVLHVSAGYRPDAVMSGCRMRARVFAVVIAAVLIGSSACGTHGLSFVSDERVDIVSPADRSKLDAPVTVRWTAKDVAIGSGRGTFAVLVDRIPPRSGKTLAWLFKGDSTCKGPAGRALCETPAFLAERGVYTTTDTSFTVDRVARLSGNQRRRQFHEATVVLLDRAGRRTGEGAWSVQFELREQN